MLLTRSPVRSPLDSALAFALGHGWPVVPGCDQGRHHRRCGRPDCLAAPPHPASEHAHLSPTREETTIRRWWRHGPHAPVLLAVGLAYDVLCLPARRAEAALHVVRGSGYRLGPTVELPDGRVLLWVRPGFRLGVEMQQRRSWPYGALGLECLTSGSYVLAPPFGGSTWIERPTAYGQALPRGADLLPLLVQICR